MAQTIDLNLKANVRQKTDGDLSGSVGLPVVSLYEADSVASQTRIPATGNLPFIIDINNKENVSVLVDGKELTFGAANDYIFSEIASDNTSSVITLNVALSASLNIKVKKFGIKKEAELLVDSRFTQSYDYATSAFQGFVDERSLLTAINGAPSSTQFRSSVVGRASIPDLANDLKPRMAIDRVIIQQIFELQNEFGPNGERVFAATNDDRGLIRFVGNWGNSVGTNGSLVFTAAQNDYIEIVFYGTGLNMMPLHGSQARDIRATVDGGSEGGNIYTAGSDILTARNYATNHIIPVTSGLSLGLHTVKIRNGAAGGINLNTYGFEIVNESSSVNARPGTAYINGKKLVLSTASSLGYNSGSFDSVLQNGASTSFSSTRGARVLTYLKSDSTIGRSAILTNSAQANLGSADHTNEEIARTYYWREFGAGRTDDFSLFTANGNYAFTLDDGTTSLSAFNTQQGTINSIDTLRLDINAANQHTNFTFVGTGLDIVFNYSSSATNQITVAIDGTTLGTITNSTAVTGLVTKKVVSGLPYGTHYVRLFLNGVAPGSTFGLTRFIAYQPKKPALPAGAIELADYNVMANYVANTVTGVQTIGTGVLRKQNLREHTFVGAWTITGVDVNTYIGGWDTYSNTGGNYHEYTFFGTGFELRSYNTGASTTNSTVSLQNLSAGGSLVTLNSTNFPGLTTSGYGSVFTYATGNLNESAGLQGSGISINGLTLGLYKVRFTIGSGFMEHQTIDVITPIHSHKSNINYDQQNTLPVGSQGISDNRKTSAIKENYLQKKNVSQAFGVTSGPTTTSTLLIPCPEMSLTHYNTTGKIRISYSANVQCSASFTPATQAFVDGLPVGTLKQCSTVAAAAPVIFSESIILNVSPGFHKIDLYWLTSGGTGTATSTQRNILVEEI